jgi:hypothetical protein
LGTGEIDGQQNRIMSKETSEEKTEKQGRIVQVIAAALAAITAALLGSTLGVAGTVVGAGLASVITTVGGELYLRSLQRTRDAALRAREVLTVPGRRRAVDPDDQPTVRLETPERKGKPRWAIVAGVSVVAFAVAILVITGVEGATGNSVGGGTGTTLGKIIGGGEHAPDQKQAPPPVTVTETPEAPATTATPPPTSTTPPPSTTPTSPPTSPTQPTTPSPTQTPPTSSAPPTTN